MSGTIGAWPAQWGERPRRTVPPLWASPGLLLRQVASVAAVGVLAGWRQLPRWALTYGVHCLQGAAGARGQGCIGFPAHPVWEITSACNMHCIHCHVSGGRAERDELTTAEGKRLLAQLARIREFRMLAFTGGEPLVRPDLFELLAYAQALGFSNTLATNGTLIDDGVARDLRRRGVAICAVSLDGCNAATHDYVRDQRGAFEAALRGIQALGRAGIPLHINVTAMAYNLGQLDELVALADELGAAILIVYQLVAVGRGQGIKAAALSVDANERLIKGLVRAQSRSVAVIEPVAGPQYWAWLLARAGIRGGPLLRSAEEVFHGCSAGRGFVYIKPNGEVWPCPFLPLGCGNVGEAPFEQIYRTSAVLNDLRGRERGLRGRCGDCAYRRVCGGCRARAWACGGDYLAEDPSCFIQRAAADEGGVP